MTRREVTEERRRELVGVPVTLDGRPACIGGIRNDFAGIVALPDGARFEWSWPAVDRIVSAAQSAGQVPGFRS